MEVDDDVDVILGAVHLDGTIFLRRAFELGDLGRSGVGQLIRVLVQGIPVQPMRQGLRVILRKYLLHKRIRILFQIVDGGSLIARCYQQRQG